MNISKIAFASLAVGAIILLSVSISEKDAGTYAKRALLKTVVRASKTYNNRRLQNTKVNCGFVDKVLKELRNCFYYLPEDWKSHSSSGKFDCIRDELSLNEVLKRDSWAFKTFEDKASPTLDLVDKVGEAWFGTVEEIVYPFPESKANEIINDVSVICENGKPLEDDLTQKEFNALIDQYLDSNVLPVCLEYGESQADCEMFLDAINTVLEFSNLGGSLDVASINDYFEFGGFDVASMSTPLMSSEAGLHCTAGVWRKILYGVSISASTWF